MSRRDFRIVCTSGYFDGLHMGHVAYLESARLLGDKLVVILNHDRQRTRQPRVPLEERRFILSALRAVDDVIVAIDNDAHVCETLRQICPTVFAKGLHASDMEVKVCHELGIQVVEQVGGKELHMHELLASFR